MFEEYNEKAVDEYKRRKVLMNLASAGVLTVAGTGLASAENSRKENLLLTFDPENTDEVREAYLQLLALPNANSVKSIKRRQTKEQIKALIAIAESSTVVTGIETADGSIEEVSGESMSSAPDSNSVTLSSAGSESITAVSALKNQLGTTEGTLKHHVHWEYDGTEVIDVSHWKEVSSAVVYTFKRMSTNYLDNRGEWAVSRMVADFESIYLGGVVKQIGTEVWASGGGGWAVNQL